MTTREEYAEAAYLAAFYREAWLEEAKRTGEPLDHAQFARCELICRVLRALADGAVLCDGNSRIWVATPHHTQDQYYAPLDPQDGR